MLNVFLPKKLSEEMEKKYISIIKRKIITSFGSVGIGRNREILNEKFRYKFLQFYNHNNYRFSKKEMAIFEQNNRPIKVADELQNLDI